MDDQLTFEFKPRPTIKGFPELRWTGKRPFEYSQYFPAQLKESYGQERDGWINKIFWGDNLQVMSHMLKDYRGQINLIYIDPPFDSKADYKRKIEIKGIGKAESDSSSFEEKQYGDIWTNDEYLQFMYEKYSRVITLWGKTIYNTSVSQEDIFIWRCQAFELLCTLTDEIKSDAYNSLAPKQANPNLRNYLTVVSSKYNIAKPFEEFFADVKDVRDKMTHNNPRKTVTEGQVKNAYGLINHFLIATIAELMELKCQLPAFFLTPKK